MTSYADWIVETSTTTGPGTYNLSGSPPAGTSFFTFRQRFANGEDEIVYWVVSADRTKWEKNRGGLLTYGTPDTLTRNVVDSTDGGSAISWVGGDMPLRIYVSNDAEALELAIGMGLGATRPEALKYGMWVDEDGISAGVDEVNFYDGNTDIPIGKVDTAAHTFKMLVGVDDTMVTVFSANGTFTPSPKMIACDIYCIGAGGNGGSMVMGGAGFVSSAGGGGSGGLSIKRATAAEIGASKPVVVGAGGSPGGDTYVGTSLGAAICAAKGGIAGSGGSAGGSGSGGAGAGTSGAVGDLTIAGAGGDSGFYATIITVSHHTTSGGPGPLGGGCTNSNVANSVGGAGTGYGSGGGGAYGYNSVVTLAGGTGASGVVFIRQYLKA